MIFTCSRIYVHACEIYIKDIYLIQKRASTRVSGNCQVRQACGLLVSPGPSTFVMSYDSTSGRMRTSKGSIDPTDLSTLIYIPFLIRETRGCFFRKETKPRESEAQDRLRELCRRDSTLGRMCLVFSAHFGISPELALYPEVEM